MVAQNAMRAVQFRSYGAPEVLEVGSAEIPSPGPKEVVVEVAAFSVNTVDLLGPRKPCTLPASTSRSRWSSALKRPKRLTRPCTRTGGSDPAPRSWTAAGGESVVGCAPAVQDVAADALVAFLALALTALAPLPPSGGWLRRSPDRRA